MRSLVLLAAILTIVSCTQMNENLQSDWSESMHNMADSFNQLFPYLYEGDRFEKTENKEKIESLITQLVDNSATIKTHQSRRFLGDDPLFNLTLKELQNTNLRAQEAFKRERFENAKYLLKNSMLYCAQCHTHSNRGLEIIEWDNFASLETVHPIEKSQVYTSTRQYAQAIDVLSNFLDSSERRSDNEVLLALKQYIRIVGQQRRNPQMAVDKINKMQKMRNYSMLSNQTRVLTGNWKNELKLWAKALEQKKLPSVETLVKMKDDSRFRSDKAYVTAVRNSLIFHDALRNNPKYYQKPIIYHKLGDLYDHYPEMSSWGLPETYFQACITLKPHTKQAQACFKSLKTRLHNIYRFNGTLSIPLHVKERLSHYRSLSSEAPRPGSPRGNFYDH
jgi:hypothetical protein